jgi:hypothetical protein
MLDDLNLYSKKPSKLKYLFSILFLIAVYINIFLAVVIIALFIIFIFFKNAFKYASIMFFKAFIKYIKKNKRAKNKISSVKPSYLY